MRVAFIINGSGNRARHIAALIARDSPPEIESEVMLTEYRNHASSLAYEACRNFDVIVACGGDGTVSECVNGMMQFHSENVDSLLPFLAPWPMGTGNDFVRNFSFTPNLNLLFERILHPKKYLTDVGRISSGSHHRYFINECSAGLGPEVVERTTKFPARWHGGLKFSLAIMRTMPFFRKKEIHITANEFTWRGKVMALVVANGKYFGGGIGIAPEAKLHDGFFEITIIGNVSLFDYLRYMPDLRRGKKIHHPEVHYYRTTDVTISGNGLIEVDGEIGPPLTVRCEVLSQQIVVI